MKNLDQRNQIIEYSLKLNSTNLSPLRSGNISLRGREDDIDGYLITPSGKKYETLKPEDIVFMGLNEEGIKNTIIADNTGGILMQRGEVDICIVGTDRTLANGDVCNKVGTYLKALAAYDNKIPFYVALPSSTIDWNTKDHKEIPIEERNPEELSHIEGFDEGGKIKKIQIYPKKSKAMNLAFDITPARYVTGLITEKGICDASTEGLKKLFK